MKFLKSFGTPLMRAEMKNIKCGYNDLTPCSNQFCYAWCMDQAGFGGECYNGQCYCFG